MPSTDYQNLDTLTIKRKYPLLLISKLMIKFQGT